MDYNGDLFLIVNSKQSISIGTSYDENDNRIPFFLVQFDPAVFYNPLNNRLFAQDKNSEYKTSDYDGLCRKILAKLHKEKNAFNFPDDEKGSPEDRRKSYYQVSGNKLLNDVYHDDNNGFGDDFSFTKRAKFT